MKILGANSSVILPISPLFFYENMFESTTPIMGFKGLCLIDMLILTLNCFLCDRQNGA